MSGESGAERQSGMMSREQRVHLGDGLAVRVVELGTSGADPGATALPVLLLHGFTGSVEAWGERLLEGLAATGRGVVAVDLLGHGGSDVPAEPSRYAMERQLGDLEAVLGGLGVERAAWIGYSMGARLALGAAIFRPRRVAALVLESGSPGLAIDDERRARRAADEALAARLEEAGPEALAAFVDDWMAQPLFETQRGLPADVRKRERRRRLAAHPRGLAGALRGLGTGAQPSLWERLPEVEVPALLLTGRLDARFEAIADRMAARMPASVRASVPDAGHAVHLERPRSWLARVEAFLAEAEAEAEADAEAG